MTTKLFGEQILDEIRGEGLTYCIFEKAERERLCKIESRSELRAFYDEVGYDCVSVTGSPSELVRTISKQRHNLANSRGWQSYRRNASSQLGVRCWLLPLFVGFFLFKCLFSPERALLHNAGGALGMSLGHFLGHFLGFGSYRVFDHYQTRRRARIRKVLRETESHLAKTDD